jgi:hypothetical protein
MEKGPASGQKQDGENGDPLHRSPFLDCGRRHQYPMGSVLSTVSWPISTLFSG